MAGKKPVKGKAAQKRVSVKISKLMGEGEPQKKAVGMALNMERGGRLGSQGGYYHVPKKRRKKG